MWITARQVLTGVIRGEGGLTKQGAGVLTFSGANPNTYSGGTSVEAGTLRLSGASGLADASSLNVSSGAIFSLDISDVIGSIGGSGDIELASGVLLTAGADNNSTIFEGVISGLGSFSKIGIGNLSLAGANLYEGLTVIEQGGLTVSGSLSDRTDVSVAVDGLYALLRMTKLVRLLVLANSVRRANTER